MSELTFIPLKAPDGQVAGHARVQNGTVALALRGAVGSQVLILTDGGSVTGETGSHIRASGRVQAVALHDNGQLRCCGFARGCPYTADDVRTRLTAMYHKDAPVQQRPAQTPPAAPIPFSRPPEPLAAPSAPKRRMNESPAPEQAAETFQWAPAPDWKRDAQDWAATQAHTHPSGMKTAASEPAEAPPEPEEADVQNVLNWLQNEAAAGFFVQTETTAETPEETADRTESFAALLSRCEQVFEKIAVTPENRADASPLPTAQPHVIAQRPPAQRMQADPCKMAEQSSEEPAAKAPITQAEQDAGHSSVVEWHASVDALLAQSRPDRSGDTRKPVINPFPHIFPEARFFEECDNAGTHMLIGTWRRGIDQFTVTAVRGEYSPNPPSHLPGFTRYIRTRQGGFWVRVDD